MRIENEASFWIGTLLVVVITVEHGFNPSPGSFGGRPQRENRAILTGPAVEGRAIKIACPIELQPCHGIAAIGGVPLKAMKYGLRPSAALFCWGLELESRPAAAGTALPALVAASVGSPIDRTLAI